MSFQIDSPLSVPLHMLLFILRKHAEKGYITGKTHPPMRALKQLLGKFQEQ